MLPLPIPSYTSLQKHPVVMSFDQFSFNADILTGIKDMGYTTPTPIKHQAIPPILKGQDLLGLAQTGTGKTAAFVLPILQRLTRKKGQRQGQKPANDLNGRAHPQCPPFLLFTNPGLSVYCHGGIRRLYFDQLYGLFPYTTCYAPDLKLAALVSNW